jgi:hypothetical protein
MKELKVDFEMIGMAMEDVSRDTMEYYLDKETGQVIVLSEEIARYAEEDEDSIREDLPDWQKGEIQVADNIRNDSIDRYINIPEKPTHESYNIMVDFAEKVEDELLREKLYIALDGKGAFGRFKRVISDYPDYEREWFEFKEGRIKEEVMEWLSLIGIKGI